MSLRINANTFATRRYLDIDSGGVTFCESVLTGGVRRFRFDQIDCVLMSPENVLSFQVGQEVFSLQTKPNEKKHQQVIAALLEHVNRAARKSPAGM